MRILLINNCHERRGGADIVYFNTAKLLRNYGHEVYFFSQKNEGNQDYENSDYFVNGINYRNLSIPEKVRSINKYIYNKDAENALRDYLKVIKPDVVHLHLFLGSLTVSILKVLNEQKIPVVMTVHDYRLQCPSNSFLDGKNNICEKCINGKFINCVINKCSDNKYSQSLVVAIEAYFRRFFISPINYINKFIFVSEFIYNKHIESDLEYKEKGIKLFNFIPELNHIKASTNRGNYFLFYGRISEEKGVRTLLESFCFEDNHLKIVGTGPILSELKDDFKKDNIEYLGYKTGMELESLIRNASFIIVPSEWYENNPLTILEAYSLGKPVIGADIGGIPEIIIDGKSGYLFESGSKDDLHDILRKAMSLSDEKYLELSISARKFADENFNPQNHYLNLIELYEELLYINQ